MVEYNGAMYRYVHNLQGDIVGILDSAGALVVEYKYDAWGNPISTTGSLKTSLGELNPFRYRGYVWDTENALYYLRNRYYFPNLGRFLNADTLCRKAILRCNLYSYCHNTPVILADHNGFEETYTVVLNVYDPTDSYQYGHYDISIISESGSNFVSSFSDGGFESGDSGITLSFGGTETGSRVDVYPSKTRKNRDVSLQLILMTGIEQSSINDFVEWFHTSYSSSPERKGKKKNRYYRWTVIHEDYNTYDAEVGPYCGNGCMFLAEVISKFSAGTNAQIGIGFNAAVKEMQTPLKVNDDNKGLLTFLLRVFQPN